MIPWLIQRVHNHAPRTVTEQSEGSYNDGYGWGEGWGIGAGHGKGYGPELVDREGQDFIKVRNLLEIFSGS